MKPAPRKKISKPAAAKGREPACREIIGLIQSARRRAFQAVNTELIELTPFFEFSTASKRHTEISQPQGGWWDGK